MDNVTIFGLALVFLYILYFTYPVTKFIEPFISRKTKNEIIALEKTIRLLKANIIDLTSIAKHNTLNICRVRKSIEEAGFHNDS